MVAWIIRQPISPPLHVYKLRSRASQSRTQHFTIHSITHFVSCSQLLTPSFCFRIPLPHTNRTSCCFGSVSLFSLSSARISGAICHSNVTYSCSIRCSILWDMVGCRLSGRRKHVLRLCSVTKDHVYCSVVFCCSCCALNEVAAGSVYMTYL
jgi:hypothetical protein